MSGRSKAEHDIDMSEQKVAKARERVGAIAAPEDIRTLSHRQIPELCDDLRRVLIERTEKNGGHLASNLGVVEATVAIHRVFDSPTDHIIFDVGHQSYVHKLLTGRAEAFDTLRQPGGLSGFPRRNESRHDAFGTGHASTSLSAAIGFAQADHLQGSDAFTVVVLGDGALTGGMIHEALNNCAKYLKIVIILNENEMSISKNVGRFAHLLTGIRTARGYSCTKSLLERGLGHLPLLGRPILRGLSAVKQAFKRLLYRSNYFESMGLNYFGPVDGNDERRVERVLRIAKKKGGCSLVHVRTVKGKGYGCAEHDPDTYHGLSPAAAKGKSTPTFSATFGKTLTRLADNDSRICAITAAMCQGTGLTPFFKAHPTRFFDVGIAEAHAMTFAAGLSASGMMPAFAVYSTFLQRSYDQILHDAALQELPLLIAVDRAGLNAHDGATHHGIYDVSFLSHIPGVDIYEPPTTLALESRLETLFSQGITKPVAVRYPSGRDHADVVSWIEEKASTPMEGLYVDFDLQAPPATVAVTYGRLSAEVLKAVRQSNQDVGVVVLERLRPWNGTVQLLHELCTRGTKKIVLCEEGIRSGGIAMNVTAELCERLDSTQLPDIRILAIDDRHGVIPVPAVGQGIWDAVRLSADDIAREIKE